MSKVLNRETSYALYLLGEIDFETFTRLTDEVPSDPDITEDSILSELGYSKAFIRDLNEE